MSLDWLNQDLARWTVGTIAAAVIALLAWRAGALATSGAVAAVLTGAALVGGGGWWAGALLVAFFITSSALSRAGERKDGDLLQARGSRRDAVQVFANGGVAAIAALILAITNDGIWAVALVASLAAANADTWATELGRLSGQPPRSIVTLRRVPAGTSGAISFPGTLASFIGAAFIAILASFGWSHHWLVNPASDGDLARLLMIVAGCGFLGSLVDSLLGATIQARYRCPTCQKETEAPIHSCGTSTRLVAGLPWVTNDVVNVLSVAIAAGVALALATTLG